MLLISMKESLKKEKEAQKNRRKLLLNLFFIKYGCIFMQPFSFVDVTNFPKV